MVSWLIIAFFWMLEYLLRILLTTMDRRKPQAGGRGLCSSLIFPISHVLWTNTAWSLSTFVFSDEVMAIHAGWWSLKSTLGQSPIPVWIYLLTKTLSSNFYLQIQLMSKGGQIPRKELWLN